MVPRPQETQKHRVLGASNLGHWALLCITKSSPSIIWRQSKLSEIFKGDFFLKRRKRVIKTGIHHQWPSGQTRNQNHNYLFLNCWCHEKDFSGCYQWAKIKGQQKGQSGNESDPIALGTHAPSLVKVEVATPTPSSQEVRKLLWNHVIILYQRM